MRAGSEFLALLGREELKWREEFGRVRAVLGLWTSGGGRRGRFPFALTVSAVSGGFVSLTRRDAGIVSVLPRGISGPLAPLEEVVFGASSVAVAVSAARA